MIGNQIQRASFFVFLFRPDLCAGNCTECANISICIQASYGCYVSVHVTAMLHAGLQMQSRKRLSRDSLPLTSALFMTSQTHRDRQTK